VDVLGSDAELIPYQERNFKYDLLFLGMSNPQNVDAMKFFLGEIFPNIVKGKPDVRLAIAGKISNDIQNICNDLQVDPQLLQNIEIMGYVPDLSALYYGARLMLCPVRTGGGTNMRLVEAMSYSLPIITTRQCAGALSMQNNVNALITDDPVEYTEYVLQALADPQRAQQISHEIKQTYDRQYAKSVIYEQLDTLFGIN
jgi:glycosyltransferase involved in cell wall biosynthesis